MLIIAGTIGIILLIVGIMFYYKSVIKSKIKKEFGQVPTRKYDERDFTYIGKLHEHFPITDSVIDDATWNDLQMPVMFQKMNNTQSIVGDQYFYRHLRQQHYDKKDILEKHIQYFQENEKERLEMQYHFRKIKGRNENKLIDLLRDRNEFPKMPYFWIYLTGFLGILVIVLMVLAYQLGYSSDYNILGMVFMFVVSLILFSVVITPTASTVSAFNVYNNTYNSAKYLKKILPDIFKEEKDKIIPAVKKLSKTHWISSLLIEVATAQGGSMGILTVFGIYFGIYGATFQWLRWYFGKYQKEIIDCAEVVGYIDMCISLASYRETLKFYSKPNFVEQPCVEFKDIYHPLITNPVLNSHSLAIHHIITGANASGKSTFARTIALSVLLGQTINICFAKEMTYLPSEVYTSFDIGDDLLQGDSFYVAEIKRLKCFLEKSKQGKPAMFFIDEILKGTNAIERIASASMILGEFAETNNFVCLTTHDTELTYIMEDYYKNYHFKEITETDEIFYDYQLYDGPTTSSNAIRLLEVMDYDTEIIQGAHSAADTFRKTKKWTKWKMEK